MKLLRHGEIGRESPAVVDTTGQIRDLSGVIHNICSNQLGDEALQELARCDINTLPIVDPGTRIGPCVADVKRFFCIGLNYSDHAIESGLPIPNNPIVFMKVCEVTGPNDPITIPKNSQKTDWEVELGVVIGKIAQHVSQKDALSYVAGYCVINDVSERAFQTEFGGQWVKGKSCDSFGPIGPYLVTRDEIPDPQALNMFLDVNGERRQTGNTSKMIFSVAEIIAHLSKFITLRPGDIISTGTPSGVGMGMDPPMFLKAGDNIKLGISDLGQQFQKVIAF
ncbi:Fumarylacetoacetate hydrolase family protein [hydrothermal vent metagenome]|uniref:Fumarylacetoacetate hydrolase family protein n=1 Tax=hydrothermal vent metagenome TaxID=652676 RepID=A0A3B0RWC0_9ZZZZ